MRLVVGLIGALVLVFAGAAQAEGLYADSNGEWTASGLPTIDINTVRVSNDPAAGTLTFAVALTGAPPISGNARVSVMIWAGGKGSPGAAPDYSVTLAPGGASLAAGGGGTPTGSTVTSSYKAGVATLTIRAADVGVTKTLDFEALTVPDYAGHQTYAEDVAPDIGAWSYTLSKSEPPPASAPTVVQATARFSPAAPKHGAAFVVTGLVARLSNGSAQRATAVTCVARLGTAVIHGTGAGGCTFLLAKKSKGKDLVVATRGTTNGETVASSDSLRIG
jgi:hypothetical protein